MRNCGKVLLADIVKMHIQNRMEIGVTRYQQACFNDRKSIYSSIQVENCSSIEQRRKRCGNQFFLLDLNIIYFYYCKRYFCIAPARI